jgi:predicted negative regulator of RcsB-dependent stress response
MDVWLDEQQSPARPKVFESLSLKLVEVLLLLAAGVLFAWWQFRDIRRAQEQSARERAALAERENGAADPAAKDRP